MEASASKDKSTKGMSEVQAQAVLLGLEVLRELLRETPELYVQIEDVVLSDVSFMDVVPIDELNGLLSRRVGG